jgi:hypothetical protein
MDENRAVPVDPAKAKEFIAQRLFETLTDTREPTFVVPNRRERRQQAREARRGR